MRAVDIGPVRTPHGVADVHFDGVRLTLVCFRGWPEVLGRYRWVVLSAALLPLAVVPSLDGGARWAAMAIAAVIAAPGLASLATRALMPPSGARVVEIAEADLSLMDPVTAGLRPRLSLYTDDGRLDLVGWPWRRHQLRRLQRALAAA